MIYTHGVVFVTPLKAIILYRSIEYAAIATLTILTKMDTSVKIIQLNE